MTETLAHGYSSDSTQQKLSKEYQHDRVKMVLKILVLWTKVASALEGLRHRREVLNIYQIGCFRVPPKSVFWIYNTFENNFGIDNDFTKYSREREVIF